jgi:hypothetical protein
MERHGGMTMEFDIDKVTTKEEAVIFYKDHHFEVIANCMIIHPDTTNISDRERMDVQVEAMNMVASTHGYGPFKHLCTTCKTTFPECKSDPMFGWGKAKDNVCYCEGYEQKNKVDE